MSLKNNELPSSQPETPANPSTVEEYFKNYREPHQLPPLEGFSHLFPATLLTGHLSEASTIEGAERLLGKLDKNDKWHDYAAAGIAEHYTHIGEIEAAQRILDKISEEAPRSHVLTEMVFYEEDHPDKQPLPLEDLKRELYKTAVEAYNNAGDVAAAHAVIEAAEALPETDMPVLAQVVQEEHPELRHDLEDDDLIPPDAEKYFDN